MKKIRLGNDIQFNWSLFNSEGEPYNIEGADLIITYTTFRGVTEVTDFSVSGNVVSWTFKGKDQKILGDYIITLQKNAGEDGMITIDKCSAFRLVARSCDTGGEDTCNHLKVEIVELQSEVDGVIVDPVIPEIGENGNWFVNGKDTGKPSKGEDGKAFTYADFTPEQIEELQKPATDAADSLLRLEKAIESAEQSRVLAENNRNESELLREQSELGREQAETERSSAETKREENESKRLTAEQARIQAESARSTAEQDRVSKEQSRVSAEEDRVAEETKRSEAESQRAQAETKRAEAETARVLAETKRSEAEASRISAETARVSAEETRVTEFEQLKQDSQTAIDNANKSATSANDAANKANEAAESVESRLSQVYANYDAIVSSGETDQNKIYIDAETNTSYRFNGTEFVSIGGGSSDDISNSFPPVINSISGKAFTIPFSDRYNMKKVFNDWVTFVFDYLDTTMAISYDFVKFYNDSRNYFSISKSGHQTSFVIVNDGIVERMQIDASKAGLQSYWNAISFNLKEKKCVCYENGVKKYEGEIPDITNTFNFNDIKETYSFLKFGEDIGDSYIRSVVGFLNYKLDEEKAKELYNNGLYYELPISQNDLAISFDYDKKYDFTKVSFDKTSNEIISSDEDLLKIRLLKVSVNNYIFTSYVENQIPEYYLNKEMGVYLKINVLSGKIKLTGLGINGRFKVDVYSSSGDFIGNTKDNGVELAQGEYIVNCHNVKVTIVNSSYLINYNILETGEIEFSEMRTRIDGYVLSCATSQISKGIVKVNHDTYVPFEGLLSDKKYIYPVITNTSTNIKSRFLGQILFVGEDSYVAAKAGEIYWKKLNS